MEGSNINKLGKKEKNSKVKEGPCIFPFKYKHKKHDECFETEKGAICATQVNAKGTLEKYGYCNRKKGTEKKALKRSSKKQPRSAPSRMETKKFSRKIKKKRPTLIIVDELLGSKKKSKLIVVDEFPEKMTSPKKVSPSSKSLKV